MMRKMKNVHKSKSKFSINKKIKGKSQESEKTSLVFIVLSLSFRLKECFTTQVSLPYLICKPGLSLHSQVLLKAGFALQMVTWKKVKNNAELIMVQLKSFTEM